MCYDCELRAKQVTITENMLTLTWQSLKCALRSREIEDRPSDHPDVIEYKSQMDANADAMVWLLEQMNGRVSDIEHCYTVSQEAMRKTAL